MKKIALVAKTCAAVELITLIRQYNLDCQISLFVLEGEFLFRRDRLVEYVIKECSENDIKPVGDVFYKENNVDVKVENISRINLKHKRIYTTEKHHYDFDDIIVEQTPHTRLPHIKGHQKTGVFTTDSLVSAQEIIAYLPYADTVALVYESVETLKWAKMLRSFDKDILIVNAPSDEDNDVQDTHGELWRSLKADEEVCFIPQASLDEIIGDGDVKAVRLNSGKVLGSDMVLFEHAMADERVFSEPVETVGGFIKVSSQCQTNYPGLFAFGPQTTNDGRKGWAKELVSELFNVIVTDSQSVMGEEVSA